MEREKLKRLFSDEELQVKMYALEDEQRELFLLFSEMAIACFNDKKNHMVVHFVHNEDALKTFSLNCDFEETAFITNQACEGLMAVIKDMEQSRGAAH